MIDTSGATTYFKAHLKGGTWSQASAIAKSAAISTARRILSRALGRAMSDTESTYVEGDLTRDEYAVYEQAIYLIENGAIANGDGTAPQPILTGSIEQPDTPRTGETALYAPEALRWLGYTGACVIKG